ncbi:heme-binding-like protein At3g10130, chloroplastic [Apium graveolens]|uniref:heme-binding-like protein At3g10130, chloroplastic n=1 Tax=Apium graveolens TaxID=4045 RepID=UPI003D7946F4
MGMIFGKISVETPKYEVVKTTGNYEIRKYPGCVVAQVTYKPSQFKGNKDGGFMILANYIGALRNPQNKKAETIAMTAPVVTKSGDEESVMVMEFILPDKYKKAEEAPEPVDERVMISEERERKYGVVKFSGSATEKVVEEKVGKLREVLERDGIKVVGEYMLGRFNPPWTLPMFKTNELMIPVE